MLVILNLIQDPRRRGFRIKSGMTKSRVLIGEGILTFYYVMPARRNKEPAPTGGGGRPFLGSASRRMFERMARCSGHDLNR